MSEVAEEFPTSIWSESPVHPWHRFFARVVDMSINGIIYLWPALILVMLADIYLLESFFNFLSDGYGKLLDIIATAFIRVQTH